MNIFYLFSVISSRFVNLLTVVVLSYFLSAKAFGQYSLVTTNALFLHLIFTSWITNSIWRDVSKSGVGNETKFVAAAIRYTWVAGCAYAIFLAIAFFALRKADQYILAILILAPLILAIELTLVILNSQKRAREYSLLSFLRGIICLALSLGFIAIGWGLAGALAGQLLGTFISLILFRPVRNMFGREHAAPMLWSEIDEKIRFGVVSTIALNIYMLANALVRNFIALKLGESEAGYFSLASDMFFAPIALFATSLSLSSIPVLYQTAGTTSEAKTQHASDFLMINLALALPYACGGAILGPQLARLILHESTATSVSTLAGYGAIQGAGFAFLTAVTTLALTSGRLRIALGLSLSIIGSILVSLFLAGAFGTLENYAIAVTIVVVLMSIASMIFVQNLLKVALPKLEILKIVISSFAMLAFLLISFQTQMGILRLVLTISAGCTIYLILTLTLKTRSIGALLQLQSN
jgi:O-antigen/teichoic acid export membrane protein